jgi:hypothetical protein
LRNAAQPYWEIAEDRITGDGRSSVQLAIDYKPLSFTQTRVIRGEGFMFGLLFRLPAIVYFIVSGICVLLGIMMFFALRADDAARAAALKHKPPAEIALDQLNPNTYKSDYNEIVLRAQTDPGLIVEQIKTKRSREVGRTLFMPVFPNAAKSADETATAVIVIDGKVSDEQLMKMFVGPSAVGGTLVVDGILDESALSDRSTAIDAFANKVKLSQNFAIVKPFVNGRNVDLAPTGSGSVVLILALLAALLSAAYGYFRKRGEGTHEGDASGYQPGA